MVNEPVNTDELTPAVPDEGGALNEAQRAERDAAIWRMRLKRFSLRTIAQEVGLSHVAVWKIIVKQRGELLIPLIAEVVAEEDEYLDYLREKIAPLVEAGSVQAITEARKISESRRKLYKADGEQDDTPQKSDADREVDELFKEIAAGIEAEEEQLNGIWD